MTWIMDFIQISPVFFPTNILYGWRKQSRIPYCVEPSCLFSLLQIRRVSYPFLIFHGFGSFQEYCLHICRMPLNFICPIFFLIRLRWWVWEENHRGVIPFNPSISSHREYMIKAWFITDNVNKHFQIKWYLPGFSIVKLLFSPFHSLFFRSESLSPTHAIGEN